MGRWRRLATRARGAVLARRLMVPVGPIASAPWSGGRRNANLEFAHEPEEVGPLESQSARGPRAVAARLGQRRLDEPSLELAHRSVKSEVARDESFERHLGAGRLY